MKHDMTNMTYRSWQAMKQRCDCPTNERYSDYGGKGLSYPPEWKSFEKFVEAVGERPSLELTLDRKDNNKEYSKENCHWATGFMQQKNQREFRTTNTSGVKGVYCEKGRRWRAEGIYAGVNYKLYQGKDFYAACLARWEWELITWWHLHNGVWL